MSIKFFTFFLSAFIALVFTAMSFGQAVIFEDNFDSYTAGMQLAFQSRTDWSTWSGEFATEEDPFVTDAYAYSSSNSVVFVTNNDVVKTYGDLTSGKYSIAFMIYVPTGKTGQFTTMSGFTGGAYEWAMAVLFNPGGSGGLAAGGWNAATFTYAHDTWQSVEVIVDLNNDIGEFWFDGVMVHTWQWTLGSFGDGSALQLAASDFFGLNASDELYIDDFRFSDVVVSVENEVNDKGPLTFRLNLNYPNPFNPSTTIEFSVPVNSNVTLTIYNSLGQVVTTLVNEEISAGNYSVIWNGTDKNGLQISSGVYLYKMQANGNNGNNYGETKKMILLK